MCAGILVCWYLDKQEVVCYCLPASGTRPQAGDKVSGGGFGGWGGVTGGWGGSAGSHWGADGPRQHQHQQHYITMMLHSCFSRISTKNKNSTKSSKCQSKSERRVYLQQEPFSQSLLWLFYLSLSKIYKNLNGNFWLDASV